MILYKDVRYNKTYKLSVYNLFVSKHVIERHHDQTEEIQKLISIVCIRQNLY